MHVGDTIIALATGWAVSPRALVRLSGPSVPVLLRDCFVPAVEWPDRARVIAARLQLPAMEDSNPPLLPRLPLPTLIAAYPAPRSYTGEHSVELIVPGNPALIERVLKMFMAHEGVREASPGEFSARAYLNGRLTLAQAEGVAATIAARNEDELAAARRVMHGETGLEHTRRVDELAMLLALVEAGIDFTDQEDVVPIAPSALYDKVHALADELRAELGAKRGTERSSGDPVVVLVGAPNAGKSTLFNALLGRRRSVVSPVAGTTRDVISEELDLSDVAPGLRVRLMDLAGLDESVSARSGESTLAAIDAAAQRRAQEAIGQADVVVLCDPSGAFRTLGVSPAGHQVVIRVRTKGDLLRGVGSSGPAGHRASSAGERNDAGSINEMALAVCALDGWNLNPLRRAIADAAWRDRASASMSVLPRHRRAIEAALGGLDDALRALEPSRAARSLSSPELIAGSLRIALDSLTELSGRVSPDDVIGRIFATFCIGK